MRINREEKQGRSSVFKEQLKPPWLRINITLEDVLKFHSGPGLHGAGSTASLGDKGSQRASMKASSEIKQTLTETGLISWVLGKE